MAKTLHSISEEELQNAAADIVLIEDYQEQHDAILSLVTQYSTTKQLSEIKAVKPFLNGKYGKAIQVSGDGQLILDKAMKGFVYVSNRESELKHQLQKEQTNDER